MHKLTSEKCFIVQTHEPGAVFTTLNFLHNLRIRQASYIVCPWQAFLAQCNVTL